MIKVENVEIVGWEATVRGMRNPLNSWAKSDSENKYYGGDCYKGVFELGDNDKDLMKRLRNAGTDHRKFMRMITVYVDITAPLYWWKEFDTYKVGTTTNSCSTMHKIHAKEFTLDDFSHEHVIDIHKEHDSLNAKNHPDNYAVVSCYINDEEGILDPYGCLLKTVELLNKCRKLYLETKDKRYWWQMIQLLPSSYNQKRTVMLNYEVLANMYKSRKNHKLDEWHTMCDWMETLPYFELITGNFEK